MGAQSYPLVRHEFQFNQLSWSGCTRACSSAPAALMALLRVQTCTAGACCVAIVAKRHIPCLPSSHPCISRSLPAPATAPHPCLSLGWGFIGAGGSSTHGSTSRRACNTWFAQRCKLLRIAAAACRWSDQACFWFDHAYSWSDHADRVQCCLQDVLGGLWGTAGKPSV